LIPSFSYVEKFVQVDFFEKGENYKNGGSFPSQISSFIEDVLLLLGVLDLSESTDFTPFKLIGCVPISHFGINFYVSLYLVLVEEETLHYQPHLLLKFEVQRPHSYF
jgi:hypothetical protein